MQSSAQQTESNGVSATSSLPVAATADTATVSATATATATDSGTKAAATASASSTAPTPTAVATAAAAADDSESSSDDVPLAQLVRDVSTTSSTVTSTSRAGQSSSAANGSKKATTPSAKTSRAAATSSKSSSGNSKKKSVSAKRKAATAKRKRASRSFSSESSSDYDSSSSSSSDSSSDDSSSSSSSSTSSDDDVPLQQLVAKKKAAQKKKKAAAAKKKAAAKRAKTPAKKKAKSSSGSAVEKRKKKLEDEAPKYKWWLEDPLPKGKKWKTLEHNGVMFPPPYEPHGVKIIYDGEPISLPPKSEELATFFAQYLESAHMEKPQFSKNFFSDFKSSLPPVLKSKIKNFKKINFRPIYDHLMAERERKKNLPKEEKKKEKERKEKEREQYGWAMVDGHKQKITENFVFAQIGNIMVEPPGLFLGRGDHPKAGFVKARIMPEDVTLNMSKGAKVPPCPMPGHKWGGVVHNDSAGWLAMWQENITSSHKYVQLAASSRIKGESDVRKYNKSRELARIITQIRKGYEKELKSKDDFVCQRATALWVIDRLALRVGGEKGEDEADTVGCCSLRAEHIQLKNDLAVKFDFLGKDSMRYENTVKVPEIVYNNFKRFLKGKKPDEDVFDTLDPSKLNKYLYGYMEGLTAKVFRTYNASYTLEKELAKPPPSNATVDDLVLFYNRANKEVAILCNHQRSIPKSHETGMEALDSKIDFHKKEKKYLAELVKYYKSGEKGSAPEEPVRLDGKEYKKPANVTSAEKRIETVKKTLKKLEIKKTEKDEMKTIALGTSKINYMDPRISASWCARVGCPIEKVYSKTLREKFPWAMDAEHDWKYKVDIDVETYEKQYRRLVAKRREEEARKRKEVGGGEAADASTQSQPQKKKVKKEPTPQKEKVKEQKEEKVKQEPEQEEMEVEEKEVEKPKAKEKEVVAAEQPKKKKRIIESDSE